MHQHLLPRQVSREVKARQTQIIGGATPAVRDETDSTPRLSPTMDPFSGRISLGEGSGSSCSPEPRRGGPSGLARSFPKASAEQIFAPLRGSISQDDIKSKKAPATFTQLHDPHVVVRQFEEVLSLLPEVAGHQRQTRDVVVEMADLFVQKNNKLFPDSQPGIRVAEEYVAVVRPALDRMSESLQKAIRKGTVAALQAGLDRYRRKLYKVAQGTLFVQLKMESARTSAEHGRDVSEDQEPCSKKGDAEHEQQIESCFFRPRSQSFDQRTQAADQSMTFSFPPVYEQADTMLRQMVQSRLTAQAALTRAMESRDAEQLRAALNRARVVGLEPEFCEPAMTMLEHGTAQDGKMQVASTDAALAGRQEESHPAQSGTDEDSETDELARQENEDRAARLQRKLEKGPQKWSYQAPGMTAAQKSRLTQHYRTVAAQYQQGNNPKKQALEQDDTAEAEDAETAMDADTTALFTSTTPIADPALPGGDRGAQRTGLMHHQVIDAKPRRKAKGRIGDATISIEPSESPDLHRSRPPSARSSSATVFAHFSSAGGALQRSESSVPSNNALDHVVGDKASMANKGNIGEGIGVEAVSPPTQNHAASVLPTDDPFTFPSLGPIGGSSSSTTTFGRGNTSSYSSQFQQRLQSQPLDRSPRDQVELFSFRPMITVPARRCFLHLDSHLQLEAGWWGMRVLQAHQADLRRGDTIATIGRESLQGFEDLAELQRLFEENYCSDLTPIIVYPEAKLEGVIPHGICQRGLPDDFYEDLEAWQDGYQVDAEVVMAEDYANSAGYNSCPHIFNNGEQASVLTAHSSSGVLSTSHLHESSWSSREEQVDHNMSFSLNNSAASCSSSSRSQGGGTAGGHLQQHDLLVVRGCEQALNAGVEELTHLVEHYFCGSPLSCSSVSNDAASRKISPLTNSSNHPVIILQRAATTAGGSATGKKTAAHQFCPAPTAAPKSASSPVPIPADPRKVVLDADTTSGVFTQSEGPHEEEE
ncbi:unnamed protein product [Amoebophrya sp. A120]|nr:unnamed protein product [Amoebophrya sp. A120]|eukprot:GSA120T00004882001.1